MDCLGGGFLGHRALEEAGGLVTRQRLLRVWACWGIIY